MSCPLKSKASAFGKYAQRKLGHRTKIFFGLTPDSRVTLNLKSMTNAGIAAAAGRSPVPDVKHQVIEKP